MAETLLQVKCLVSHSYGWTDWRMESRVEPHQRNTRIGWLKGLTKTKYQQSLSYKPKPLLIPVLDTPAKKAQTESYGKSSFAQELRSNAEEVLGMEESSDHDNVERKKKTETRPMEWNFLNASKLLYEIATNIVGAIFWICNSYHCLANMFSIC